MLIYIKYKFYLKYTYAYLTFLLLGTEKARIEAQVKAAEIAAKMKAEAELTRQREAARLALQKVHC